MPPLDLARAAVFLDYDGTISTRDTGVALLEQFAPPTWRTIDEEYTRGEIGSRVCLLDEWDLLPKDEASLRAAAAAVPLDPGLDDLVTACAPPVRRSPWCPTASGSTSTSGSRTSRSRW